MDEVIAIKAITVEIKPINGISEPMSKPITNTAPENPNKTPTVCFVTFSFNIGPLH